MILVLDNYDSFTWNLVQALGSLRPGAQIRVDRNDHIDAATADALNAAPYFYKQDPNIPASQDVPQLHRYTAGGALGGALIKDKLFGFVSYQHIHASDLEIGTSRTAPASSTSPAGTCRCNTRASSRNTKSSVLMQGCLIFHIWVGSRLQGLMRWI